MVYRLMHWELPYWGQCLMSIECIAQRRHRSALQQLLENLHVDQGPSQNAKKLHDSCLRAEEPFEEKGIRQRHANGTALNRLKI